MPIFFIADRPKTVHLALRDIPDQRANGWRPDGTDPQVIGCVTHGDPAQVTAALAAAGVLILPKDNQRIAPEHYEKLKQHGVLPTDTTREAITKIYQISGWQPFKPPGSITLGAENIKGQ